MPALRRCGRSLTGNNLGHRGVAAIAAAMAHAPCLQMLVYALGAAGGRGARGVAPWRRGARGPAQCLTPADRRCPTYGVAGTASTKTS